MIPLTAASSDWQNPENGLINDLVYSVLPANASNSWLRLFSFSDRTFDEPIEVVGFKITINSSSNPNPDINPDLAREQSNRFATMDEFGPPRQNIRYEVALTVDGINQIGQSVFADDTFRIVTIGGIGSLFGRDWSRSEVASPTFGVLIRRGDVLGGEATEVARWVNSVAIDVYFNYEGGSITMPFAPRPVGSQRTVIGRETTPGTPATPNILLKHSKFNLQSAPEYTDIKTFGSMMPEGRFKTYEISTGDLEVAVPDYNEVSLLLSMRFGKPSSQQLAAGVWRHEWTIDPRKLSDRTTWTHQEGDFNIGEQKTNLALRSIGLNFASFTSVTMSGNAIAKAETNLRNGGNTDSVGLLGGINCVQTIAAPTGSPTSGNVQYRVKGELVQWAYNANAAAVQSALVALQTVGVGGATVTGNGPWVVTFTGENAGKEQPKIEVAGHSLTGGTSPLPGAVTVTTKGGWIEFRPAPIVPGQAVMSIAATLSELAAGKVSDLKTFGLEVADNVDPDNTFDGSGSLTFDKLIEKPYSIQFNYGVEKNSKAFEWFTKARNNDTVFSRIEVNSDMPVATGFNYSLAFEIFGQIKDTGNVTAMGEVVGKNFMIDANYSTDWGRAARIVIVNAVPGGTF